MMTTAQQPTRTLEALSKAWDTEIEYISRVVSVATGERAPDDQYNLGNFLFDHLTLRRYCAHQQQKALGGGQKRIAGLIAQSMERLDWRDTRAQKSRDLGDSVAIYRLDSDDGSDFFCDTDKAEWDTYEMPSGGLRVFASPDEAREWLNDEIAMMDGDGQHSIADSYRDMLVNGVNEPIVGMQIEREVRLWDGYHRVAAAHANEVPLEMIMGRRFDR